MSKLNSTKEVADRLGLSDRSIAERLAKANSVLQSEIAETKREFNNCLRLLACIICKNYEDGTVTFSKKELYEVGTKKVETELEDDSLIVRVLD